MYITVLLENLLDIHRSHNITVLYRFYDEYCAVKYCSAFSIPAQNSYGETRLYKERYYFIDYIVKIEFLLPL